MYTHSHLSLFFLMIFLNRKRGDYLQKKKENVDASLLDDPVAFNNATWSRSVYTIVVHDLDLSYTKCL